MAQVTVKWSAVLSVLLLTGAAGAQDLAPPPPLPPPPPPPSGAAGPPPPGAILGPPVALVPSPPPPPAPVARGGSTSAELIGRCLCSQQRVQTLHQRAQAAEHAYHQAQARLAALNGRIAGAKDTVDVNDPAQVDAQRQLVEQDEQANADLFNHDLPEAQQSIDRYNQAVADYNAACVNQIFDSAAFAAVTQTLNCAPEP